MCRLESKVEMGRLRPNIKTGRHGSNVKACSAGGQGRPLLEGQVGQAKAKVEMNYFERKFETDRH